MIELGILLVGLASVPYLIYMYGITFGKKSIHEFAPMSILPPISVVISAYNEEKNIQKRIENLVESGYPNMELVIIDDCSSDETCGRAWGALEISRVPYQLSRNDTRMGTSASYNKAIKMAKNNDVVVVTDADTLFNRTALYWLIGRLISNQSIGAVTGDLQPMRDYTQTTYMEQEYRNIYGKMCDWESAHDSTFNFNGAIMAFKRNAVGVIEAQKGADDANIGFAAIRNGFRAVYEINAIVYESIPKSFGVQYKQKIRRASGLLNAMIANRDLIFRKRKFARFFFLRMWMYLASPALFFAGVLIDPILFVLAALSMLIPFCRAFVINQAYLMVGLITIRRNVRTWESTSSLEAGES